MMDHEHTWRQVAKSTDGEVVCCEICDEYQTHFYEPSLVLGVPVHATIKWGEKRTEPWWLGR